MIRCKHLKMLTLEWYGNLVHVPEIKVFKYVKMFWFNTSPASVHRVIFSSFNFCLSTLATVSHHLELANTQLCFRDQDNLRHQNSTSPIFARWQWEQKGQKINGGEYSPVCSICFHIYLLISSFLLHFTNDARTFLSQAIKIWLISPDRTCVVSLGLRLFKEGGMNYM